MRQQTWFATVVCAIAVIPGFIVGGFAKIPAPKNAIA
jgi:hypothetical protein